MRIFIALSYLALMSACGLHIGPAPISTLPPPRLMLISSMRVPHTPIDKRRSAVVLKAMALRRAFAQNTAAHKIQVKGLSFDPNPVGFVQAAFWQADIDLFSRKVLNGHAKSDGLELLFRSAGERQQLHRGTPRKGDLVFFDDFPVGYSQGANMSTLFPAQVGIVNAVGQNGEISLVGFFAGGPTQITLNLRRNDERGNTRLYAHGEAYAARALFRSFADPFL